METKDIPSISFIPGTRPKKKVTVEALFPPIKNRVLRHLRPFLRAIGLHRPGPVTINLREMDGNKTYQYMLHLAEGYKLLSQEVDKEMGLLDAIKKGFEIAGKIAEMTPAAYAIATGIDDPDFYRTLPSSQTRILEEGIEAANPALVEEKRRMEYIYLLHTGILEQAKQAEQIIQQQAQKEEEVA